MPLIPLEDNFADIINKAQRGRQVSDERLAAVAGVSMEDLQAVKNGEAIHAVVRRVARHLRLNPDALEALARKAWYPKLPIIPRGFAMFNTPHGEYTVNSYLIWDPRSRVAAAIDTGADSAEMIDFVKSEKLRLETILLTHSHEDHVGGLETLQKATGAQPWAHELENFTACGTRGFKDAAYFHFGELAVKALHIGGHSPGMTCFLVTGLSQPVAFSGDSLFSASMANCPEGYDKQRHAIWNRIFSAPKDTVLAAGHGPLSTLLQEKEHNPFFN